MQEPIIHSKNLNVTFNLGKSNEYVAIKDETVEIFPREYIILFGPSGCGKSTLLYSILGILPPTGGQMLVKNEDIYKYSPTELVRFQTKVIGIIYQAFYLIPSLSVIDNVALPMIFSNVPTEVREARARMLLRRFGVEAQANKLPSALSGGQSQRVAVTRSLISDPEIILADEPVGNLDSKSSDAVMETLEQINNEDKKTVILVTHDAKFLPYAHRIYYLSYGEIEREVMNPEKPQIKKVDKGRIVTTELEKLSRQYPYLTPAELRVKSIVNYLTQQYTVDQLERMEKIIREILEGKMPREEFEKKLSLPFDVGGVGIRKPMTKNIGQKIDEILAQSRDVARFRRSVDKEQEKNERREFVKRLRAYLLDTYDGQVDVIQLKRLENAIDLRVLGDIKGSEFQKMIDRPIGDGGVGLHAKAAKDMGNHLEKLLAQGIAL